MTTKDEHDKDGTEIKRYVLTDADGEPIPGEEFSDHVHALDARARLMAEHSDGDKVTVEVLSNV